MRRRMAASTEFTPALARFLKRNPMAFTFEDADTNIPRPMPLIQLATGNEDHEEDNVDDNELDDDGPEYLAPIPRYALHPTLFLD